MKKETKCVHSGSYVDPNTKGINTPIFTSSVFEYLDSDKQPYPRYFNTPNQEVVVRKLCDLEDAEDGILFSSGMAAVSTTMFALVQQGDHVILQDELYGGTHAFVAHQFERLGIEFSFVPTDAKEITKAITDKTKLIFVETPTNPLLSIMDLHKVAQIGKGNNIITVIDNTFASPINQNPLQLGIDVVIHSGTKYLGGHSDICCGIALTRKNIANRIKKTALNFGGSLNATTCSLLERSLKTLSLRVERQTENAAKVAAFLDNHSAIKQVYYPGLKSHDGHDLAKSQMHGFGAMTTFELASNTLNSLDFLRNLQLIKPALSLGGIESTICSPAMTSHRKMSAAERERIGVTDGLLRLSIGIEHSDDLIVDLEQALSV
ncbi:MAG: PLP-dependent transferase [SAR324 cluster bacterium]|nr:PLP-dependent transferase [SAR324 cluster bacterium]